MTCIPDYEAFAITDQGKLRDINIRRNGRDAPLLGPAGAKRESDVAEAFLASQPEGEPRLIVLLGSGLGHALKALLAVSVAPIVVIDKETAIQNLTRLPEAFAQEPRLTWITTPDPQAAIAEVTMLQQAHGNPPLAVCTLPQYQRLDRNYYQEVKTVLETGARFDFWGKVHYPKFKEAAPRILLITSQYFLMGEVVEACKTLNLPHHLLHIENDEMGQAEFVENLLKAVLEFKPDFALTINHLGVDREGVFTELLERLELPLASWFVDNPHLILFQYAGLKSPWLSIFTWDADNVSSLKDEGFQHAFYLPLGATPERYAAAGAVAGAGRFTAPPEWKAPVSFVGNSMVYKVAQRMKAAKPSKPLLLAYKQIAAGFAVHPERSVYAYLTAHHPELMPAYEQLGSMERRLAFETMITWEATRQYRAACLRPILDFNPLLVGDKGWRLTFPDAPPGVRLHAELSYYTDLPFFYPLSEINFNCTSAQMKGAVNQRVFDVPAAGAFVLTDWRAQMDDLFEPEKEVIFYRSPEEVPELLKYYLAHPQERGRIAAAARKRVLAEHTYAHRLQTIIARMREVYGKS